MSHPYPIEQTEYPRLHAFIVLILTVKNPIKVTNALIEKSKISNLYYLTLYKNILKKLLFLTFYK